MCSSRLFSRRPRTFATLAALVVLSIVAALPLGSSPASAAPASAASESELAKRSQNPVADLISVPFQNNTSYDLGPRDRTQNVLNIQPVVPLGLAKDWNLITHTIVPIVSQPSFARGQERRTGIGDVSLSGFLLPKQALGDWLIWGAGPVINLPTASDQRLGADQWGAGVTGVGLTTKGRS